MKHFLYSDIMCQSALVVCIGREEPVTLLPVCLCALNICRYLHGKLSGHYVVVSPKFMKSHINNSFLLVINTFLCFQNGIAVLSSISENRPHERTAYIWLCYFVFHIFRSDFMVCYKTFKIVFYYCIF